MKYLPSAMSLVFIVKGLALLEMTSFEWLTGWLGNHSLWTILSLSVLEPSQHRCQDKSLPFLGMSLGGSSDVC